MRKQRCEAIFSVRVHEHLDRAVFGAGNERVHFISNEDCLRQLTRTMVVTLVLNNSIVKIHYLKLRPLTITPTDSHLPQLLGLM